MWRPQGATGRSRAAGGPKSGQCLPVTWRRCFSTCASEQGLHRGSKASRCAADRARPRVGGCCRGSTTRRKWHGESLGLPAHRPPGSGNKPSVPLPHCPPNPPAAIAAATMPKRKKQNQQQQPPQHPAQSDREEPGDEEDESRLGPPSLLGPPPMANGKPGDPKSALHRGPPGSRGPMIPPLLSLPPPPRGRGPVRGGLGPRASPYGRGWWGVNTEPPFPGPGHGGPSRESFYKEPRNPRRLKSWSLVKNTCPPLDIPPVMEDKSDRPVCRHFSKKGHCRYEDHCAFYHPGVNGPPL
ncbi:proline-rich protein 3 isoform X1 [Microtus ochrogaster]|uniref:Proline-rich protein 3 n=2 Tax=Microtus ochrogaster TaxID=79684 RepID=A0ABM0LQK1_MICOH|nr:proline-rich protein 3 isoform X1 [Microtus ochrogaster]